MLHHLTENVHIHVRRAHSRNHGSDDSAGTDSVATIVPGQMALLTSNGLVATSCIVNTESATYNLEKGYWTTKNLELPKNAGTYKLAYSNDGGETWTQIGHVLTIEISAT